MTRKLFLIASVIVLSSAVLAQADPIPRFTVDSIPTTRIMKKGTVTTTLNNLGGGTLTYSASDKSVKDATNKVTMTLSGGPFTSAVPNTGVVSLVTGKVGLLEATDFDIGTKSSGAKQGLLVGPAKTDLESALLTYSINSLEQRKLKMTTSKFKLGNVLKGATIDLNYVASTKNKLENLGSLTSVYILKGYTGLNKYYLTDTKTGTVGELWAQETTISNVDGADVDVRLQGVLNTYNLKMKIKDALSVDTAEDAGVGDDVKAYKALKVSYEANVGYAKKYQKKPLSMTDFGDPAKMTILYADIAEDGVLDGLASKVLPKGTLADPEKDGTILPASVTDISELDAKGKQKKSNLKNLFKMVGTETTIVKSSAVSADTQATMQYRMRTANESNFIKKATGPLPVDPVGPKWLTSDVVKIAGIGDDVYYALQMTFDNRINLALDGQTDGQLDNEWTTMWIAQLNSTGTLWEFAGTLGLGEGNYYDGTDGLSLEAFLAANSGETLEDLESSWGVDKTTSTSWVIVKGGGSGIFAVVPEPATVLMLISATLGAMTYGWRRWSRKGQVTA